MTGRRPIPHLPQASPPSCPKQSLARGGDDRVQIRTRTVKIRFTTESGVRSRWNDDRGGSTDRNAGQSPHAVESKWTRRAGLTRMLGGFVVALGLPTPRSDADSLLGPLTAAGRQKAATIDALPMHRLTPEAREKINSVVHKPTFYRQLPTQSIVCDPDLFLVLARNPDTLVGLWELMGVTKVQTMRVGPYQIDADDGQGTRCRLDLVYGDATQHVYYAQGSYDGAMVSSPVGGRGVFVLRSQSVTPQIGMGSQPTVTGVLDCFVQLDSLGADLLVRTLAPLVGRSADSNFEQTARFIEQVHQSAWQNPSGMLRIASQLPQVEPPTRLAFAEAIATVSRRYGSVEVGRAVGVNLR